MSKQFLYVLAISMVFISIPITGQSFLEKMAKKAEKKAKQEAASRAEKEATEKMDKELEKAFDSIEKQYEKEQKKESKHSSNSNSNNQQSANKDLNSFMSKMGVSTEPVSIEDSYSFNSSVTMNFKSYSKNGKLENDGNMISYFVTGQNCIAYEFIDGNIKTSQKEKTGTFILDYKNKATIILSDENGEKSGLAYGLGDMVDDDDWEEAMKDNPEFNKQQESGIVNPQVKKTGNTKSILGYRCEEYKYDDEDISSTFWITDEVKWNNKGVISNVFSASIYSYGTPNGFLMESVSVDKETGEKSTYTITDIDKNANKTFDVSQYQITNIGSMKMPQTE